jgi:(p)ppGpp synthase/HD superfamily hydrolase
MQLGPRFADALRLAHELHAGQTRKASQVPYVSHVLAVAATVLEYGADEDTAIAALLHDAVEDCGGLATADRIRTHFGAKVADLVLGCSDTTESPKPPWVERKNRYLEHLPAAAPDVLLISAADKLHNLNSLLREERRHGTKLWTFFRAGRDGTLWYFERLLAIFRNSQLPETLIDQIEHSFRELEDRVQPRRDSQVEAPKTDKRDSGPISKKLG